MATSYRLQVCHGRPACVASGCSYVSHQTLVESLITGQNLTIPLLHGVRKMSELHPHKFENLIVEKVKPFVYNVQLNRPKKMNALNKDLWRYVTQVITFRKFCKSRMYYVYQAFQATQGPKNLRNLRLPKKLKGHFEQKNSVCCTVVNLIFRL